MSEYWSLAGEDEGDLRIVATVWEALEGYGMKLLDVDRDVREQKLHFRCGLPDTRLVYDFGLPYYKALAADGADLNDVWEATEMHAEAYLRNLGNYDHAGTD